MNELTNKIKKRGQCAYCGKIDLITDDHIPPKNIFPKPRASNLITVPCCKSCFEGWSKDDEYFRATILSSASVSELPESQSVIDTMMRSFKRSKGFTGLIYNSIKNIKIFTETGIYLGDTSAIKFDGKRIDRVAERIVRGLFFYKKGYPVPANYLVKAKIQDNNIQKVLESIKDIKFFPLEMIQDGIFSFTYQETVEDNNAGIWLLLFFGSLLIAGIIKPNS